MMEPMGERGRQGAAPLGGTTPGPWGWDDSIGGWSNLRSMFDGSEVIRVDSGRPENPADARLIAAAPRLYDYVNEAARTDASAVDLLRELGLAP